MNMPHRDGSGDSVAADLTEFVGVMGKLKAVIEAENNLLSRGMPATLLDTIASKGALSEKYARLGADVFENARGRVLSDPEFRRSFSRRAPNCACSAGKTVNCSAGPWPPRGDVSMP